MYTFTYDSQGSNSYLVYQLKETDRIDSLSLGMVTHNQIDGLLPMIYQQKDEDQYLKYNISSRISLRQFFADTVNRKQLLGVIDSMTGALLRAEEYMINPHTLLLETDYIFVDVSSCRAYMICLPLIDIHSEAGVEINEKMSLFLKDIIFRTQFDQSEDLGYVAHIISFMNRPQAFSLPEFKDFLQQLAGNPFEQASRPSPPASPAVPQASVPSVPQTAAPPAAAHQAGVAPPYGQMPPVQSPPYGVSPPAQAGTPHPAPSPVAGMKAPVVPPVPPVPAEASRGKKKSPQMAKPSPPPVGGQGAAAPAHGEKKMSFMYLMMHYSKENKAIYDAQKKEKTAAPKMAGPQPGGPQTPFAVPGVKEGIPGSAPPFAPAPPKPGTPQQPPASAGWKAPSPAPAPYQAPAPQGIKQAPVYPPTPAQLPPMPPAGQRGGAAPGPVSFGDTTALSGGPIGETVVLGVAPDKVQRALSPYLIRQSNQERIPINKPLFRIGKEKSFVDYFIADNTAISRSHAHIMTRDGQFFVIDTNSTNHTYINGQMIAPNEETALNDGDVLKLANESFEFHLR